MAYLDNVCAECKRKKYLEIVKEEILSGEETSTSCEDEIICPWCGEVQCMEAEFDIIYTDGDHHGIECTNCGKKFTVTTEASYSYCTNREE